MAGESESRAAWVTSELARRVPILLCLLYCVFLFYAKAAAHRWLDIPHVDDDYVHDYIPQALWLISAALLPVTAVLCVAPVTRATYVDVVSPRQVAVVMRIVLGISGMVCLAIIAARGPAAFVDVYGNRLMVEHGLFAPLTIGLTPFIFCATVASALSTTRHPLMPVLALCLIWGVFLAKGSMLAYPLAVYMLLRHGGRRGFFVVGGSILMVGLAAVVLLGRLRAGNGLDEVFDDDGLRLFFFLFLHRIDQLDSFALILSQRHLESSLSLWDEIVNSVLYLMPRDVFPGKPLSFSMEATKAFRPLVYFNDAANNFTLFGQAYLIAGSLGTIISLAVLLGYFYSMALLQRVYMASSVGFWAFNLSVVIPCFMSLVGAGFFREYVLLQMLLSVPSVLIFMAVFRHAGRTLPWQAGGPRSKT
jgi:hypothetical protein